MGIMLKASDFLTTLTKLAQMFSNKMSCLRKTTTCLPEIDQGFHFSVEGVSKIVDSHRKTLGVGGTGVYSRLVISGTRTVVPRAAIYDVILGKFLISTDSMNISKLISASLINIKCGFRHSISPIIPLCGRLYSRRHILSSSVWPPKKALGPSDP